MTTATTTETDLDMYRRAVTMIHAQAAEIKALKEENERLKAHVKALEHDVDSMLEEE